MSYIPDLKWVVEFLKVSGWKTASLCAGAYLLIYANTKNLLPIRLHSWVVETLLIIFVFCGFLTLASITSAIVPFIRDRVTKAWEVRRSKHQVAATIPYLTPKEKQIIGYLLKNNQKMFTCTPDGGYAAPLISKQIIVNALGRGQVASLYEVPFKVPDHVWDVLIEHKGEFPDTPAKTLPWSIPWNLR